MKLRDFVDAFRRKPSPDGSMTPKGKDEGDDLPPVEVADVVAQAERSLVPRGGPSTAPVVQTLLGATPRLEKPRERESHEDSNPPFDLSSVPKNSRPLAVTDDHPNAAPLRIPVDTFPSLATPMPSVEEAPVEAPTTFPEFDLRDFDTETPLSLPPNRKDPLADLIQVPQKPPVLAEQGEKWFASPPTGPPEKVSASLQPPPSLPPTAPLAPSPSLPAAEPFLEVKSPSISLPALGMPVSSPGTSVGTCLQSLSAFTTNLHALTSMATLADVVAGVACEVLDGSRAFVVLLDEQNCPQPVFAEFAANPTGSTMLGLSLPADLAERLAEQQDSPVVELSLGQSLLPPDQAAQIEWYIRPTIQPPWRIVVCVQWYHPKHPFPEANDLAELLAGSIQLALALIDTPKQSQPVAAAPPPEEGPLGEIPAVVARQALWQLDEAVLLTNHSQQTRFGNPMAEFMTGCFNGELTHSTLSDIGRGPGYANAELWQQLEYTHEDQVFDTAIQTPDGATLQVRVTGLTLPSFDTPEAAEFSGGRLITVRDVTQSCAAVSNRMQSHLDAVMAELTVVRQELDAARADLFAAASAPTPTYAVPPEQIAGLRSSLMMVLGFSELLHRGEYGQMNPQQFEMFRNIEHHARAMSQILDTLFPLES